jgi:adenine deaminase
MATINAARFYRLPQLGAVAPGYFADLLLLDDLQDFSVRKVFYHGRAVFEKDLGCQAVSPAESFPGGLRERGDAREIRDTVRLAAVDAQDLEIKLPGNSGNISEGKAAATVIRIIPRQILTEKITALVKTAGGYFLPDKEFSKLAVIERHRASGNVGLGIVSNFNICRGAIASTVAHDSHNLLVIGDNDEDMLQAIEEIKRAEGGFTVVSRGKVRGTLELPLAGLMSTRPAESVLAKLGYLLAEARKLQINPAIDPFITLSFLALPVIPEIRVTDKGLFDVTRFEFIRHQGI